MTKKRNAVFIADTRPWLIGTLLLQIQEKSPKTFDEAIIYYETLSEKDKEILSSIMPCRFVKYESPLPAQLFKKKQFQRFSPLMFCRYEIFNYLKHYSHILWIDTDVCIQAPLDNLLKKADKTGFACLCEDKTNCSNGTPDICSTNFYTPQYIYRMDAFLYCSGLFVISDILPIKGNYTQWCYDKTILLANDLHLPDQGILNLLFQEFSLEIEAIGDNFRYDCYPKNGRDCSQATIIHSWGDRKFWNNWYLHEQYPGWKQAYKKWISLNGSPKDTPVLPDVSVIIPCFKPDLKYFKECLDSILASQNEHGQLYENFEIIIISEPIEEQALKEFVAAYNDKRIRLYFNDTRLGISASLNRGIKLAKGAYIARMDDDDIAAPERLLMQKKYLDIHSDIQLCTSNFSYFGDMNESRKIKGGNYAHALSLITCPFDHPTVMFRKDYFILNNLFYDEKRFYVEDWDLWSRAFDKGMKVGSIAYSLLKHRWHQGQAGQSNMTYNIMNLQAGKNFTKLGIYLDNKEISYVRLWNGKLKTSKALRLIKIFKKALKRNKKYKIYNQQSLKKVFKLRINEALLGKIHSYPIFMVLIKRFISDGLRKIFHKKKENVWKKSELNKDIVTEHKYPQLITNSLTDLQEAKKIFIIGGSLHDNIGDAAIALAEINFAKKYFPDYKIVEIPIYEYQKLKPIIDLTITPQDIIWGIGGGNQGSRYLIDENIRRDFMQQYPDNLTVIFPQSIFFANDEKGRKELETSIEAYNKNNSLIMFQRDPLSHNFAKNNFTKALNKLFPDIVCSMQTHHQNNQRNGILACIRDVNDEGGLTEEEHKQALEIIKGYGLPATFRKNRHNDNIGIKQREEIVNAELEIFAKHQIVVTDRLHGLIFAIITHTPCIAIKSQDHKIKEFMHFLKESNAVSFIDTDISKLKPAIDKMLQIKKTRYPEWNEEYFSYMANLIRSHIKE